MTIQDYIKVLRMGECEHSSHLCERCCQDLADKLEKVTKLLIARRQLEAIMDTNRHLLVIEKELENSG